MLFVLKKLGFPVAGASIARPSMDRVDKSGALLLAHATATMHSYCRHSILLILDGTCFTSKSEELSNLSPLPVLHVHHTLRR